jgi:predicted permease
MPGWNSLERYWQDVRYALRMMRRAPGFTSVAVLSLALGIGANTAIFSLINTVILRRLPVAQPECLVELLTRLRDEPHYNWFSGRQYQYFLDNNHVFSGLIGMTRPPNAGGVWFRVRTAGTEAEHVDGAYVTGNYFTVLGVKPAVGRLIGPEDDHPGVPAPVAVVSWSFWKDRFNLDPSILGRRIVVEDVPVTIVGVAARGFTGLQPESRQEVWLPSDRSSLMLVGRLKSGVSLQQARAEMAVLLQRTIEKTRFGSVTKFEMEPAGAGLSAVRDRYGRPLLVLMAVVGLLLMVACTNVASLLLARGAARQREMAIRVSLGATRIRLVRQAITESLLLSGAGALLGVALGQLGVRALVRIVANGRLWEPIHLHVSLDAQVLLFTAGVAAATGLLFGLAPAWRAWATTPASAMRDAGRAGETRVRRLFGKSLVAAQVALSLVLLAAAGLFVSRLSRIYSDLGFERDHVLLVTLDPSHSGYQRAQLAQPYRELLDRLQTIPGVRSATLSGVTPISGLGANRDATVEGYQPRPGELRNLAENWVAPKYFETFRTPLLAGRDFRFDDEGRPRVAIINRTMARHYFGDASPIGKHVLFDHEDKPYEIVGVVGDTKYQQVGLSTGSLIYMNAFQEGHLGPRFSIRTSGPPTAIGREVRRLVQEVAKTLVVDQMRTLEDQVDGDIVPERLMGMLSRLFGALGSLLAAVGVYGLLAYTVTRRINEIGVRMALGATPADVIRMVLREALAVVSAGLLIGVPLAMWGKRLAASMIPGLQVSFAASLALGAAAMIAVALIAAWLPARRAACVDPMEALRHE